MLEGVEKEKKNLDVITVDDEKKHVPIVVATIEDVHPQGFDIFYVTNHTLSYGD